ncbi:hypothetical protein IWQ55_006299, partial [Labrenzia sp. EL_208]|nr:hypothetical protein [Labrenzia sp. EL_132]MBG6233064.1 hypothetical protein [Labrenzia sp. EL_208]
MLVWRICIPILPAFIRLHNNGACKKPKKKRPVPGEGTGRLLQEDWEVLPEDFPEPVDTEPETGLEIAVARVIDTFEG